MVTLEDLKEALGIPPEDTSHDAALQDALTKTYALLWAYIGYDMSDTDTVREYEYTADSWDRCCACHGRNFIHLPVWPIIEVTEVSDANRVIFDPTTYRVIKGPGRIDFYSGVPCVTDYVRILYRAGYAPLPADLDLVVTNIASSIYNNGGTLQTSTAPLKSLTMFDAMSMSFDTTAQTNTSEGVFGAWKFILDKYQVTNQPVLK